MNISRNKAGVKGVAISAYGLTLAVPLSRWQSPVVGSSSTRPTERHFANRFSCDVLVTSKSDGFAEQQDGAASGVRFCVEDEQAVDGAGLPVGHLGTRAFQREAVLFDAAQRCGQVGYYLLRPDDPDRTGAPPA